MNAAPAAVWHWSDAGLRQRSSICNAHGATFRGWITPCHSPARRAGLAFGPFCNASLAKSAIVRLQDRARNAAVWLPIAVRRTVGQELRLATGIHAGRSCQQKHERRRDSRFGISKKFHLSGPPSGCRGFHGLSHDTAIQRSGQPSLEPTARPKAHARGLPQISSISRNSRSAASSSNTLDADRGPSPSPMSTVISSRSVCRRRSAST